MCPRRPCSPAVRGSKPTSHSLRGTVRGTILSPACVLRCPPRSTQAFPSLGRSPALAEARAPGRGSLCTCLFSHHGLGSREDISHWNGSPIALRASTLSQSQLFKHSCDQNTAHSGSGRKEQTQKSGNKEEDSHRSACQGSRERRGFPQEQWPTLDAVNFMNKGAQVSQEWMLSIYQILLGLRPHSPKMLVNILFL